jgi:nicotinate-nucleotide adenylyltransferase
VSGGFDRSGLPWAGQGQAVGLLGGSFDPAHEGHVRISEEAMRRLRLDWVWWLVSPGNPLKVRGPAAIPRRVAAARALIRNPRIKVTDVEARLGTRFTAETLARVRARHPGVRFVWIMGSDNLAQFHRWRRWRGIMAAVPVCVVARPGAKLSSRFAPAARRFRAAQLNERDARALPAAPAPAWVVLNLPLLPHSSSEIRARGGWR